jgi:hypothetical protein
MGGYKSRWKDPGQVLREKNLKAKEEADLADLEGQATEMQSEAAGAGKWASMAAGLAASEGLNWVAGSLLAPMTMGAINPITLKMMQGLAMAATTGGGALASSLVKGHYQDKVMDEFAFDLSPDQTHLMGTAAELTGSIRDKMAGTRAVTAESIGKSVALSGALQLGGSVLGNILGDSTVKAGSLASETNLNAIKGLEGLESNIIKKYAQEKGGLEFVDKVDPTKTHSILPDDLTSEQIKEWAKQEVNKPTMDVLRDRGGYTRTKDAWDMTNWDMAKNVVDWMLPYGKYGWGKKYGLKPSSWKNQTYKSKDWLKGAGI